MRIKNIDRDGVAAAILGLAVRIGSGAAGSIGRRPEMRFTRSGFVLRRRLVPTVDVVGMREWIEEGRFVASLAGHALTGDTLHRGSSTWPVAGMRADVVEGPAGRATAAASGADTAASGPAQENSQNIVVRITTADGTRIAIDTPAKKLRQAHDLALRINRASAYFTDRQRTSQDPARIA